VSRFWHISNNVFVVLLILAALLVTTPSLHASQKLIDLTSGTEWWSMDNGSSDSGQNFSLSKETESSPLSATDLSFSIKSSSKNYMQKSPQKAFLRSLVLPGWGQHYGERNSRAAMFIGVEAGFWLGIFLSREAYQHEKDNYMSFAREHAGVRGSKDHQFYVDIGNYSSQEAFNRDQLQKRDYSDKYSGNSYYWEWDSSSNRNSFEDIRISADRNKNRVYYIAGGMLLNRLFSAIDASRGLTRQQKEIREKGNVSFGYDPIVGGPALVWRGSIGK